MASAEFNLKRHAETYERVKTFLLEHGLTQVSEYKNSKEVFEVQCSCGNVYNFLWRSARQGCHKTCPDCSRKLRKPVTKRGTQKRLSDENVLMRVQQWGAVAVLSKYINITSPLTVLCECGNSVTKTFADMKRYQNAWCFECSVKHRFLRGSAHPKWKGGMNPDSQANDSEVQAWRRTIVRRANFTCSITGKVGLTMSAHHLWNYADYSDKRYDLGNGVCILRTLHEDFHNKYGYGNNTPDQFAEFANQN